MNAFLKNAQQILDVAASGGPSSDFAVLIRPDGGLHFVMESPVSLEAAAVHAGARTAYLVRHSPGGGVRVDGKTADQTCVVESAGTQAVIRDFLRDERRYTITSPTLALPAAITRA